VRALVIGNQTPGALAAVRELGVAGWTVGVGAPKRKGIATASRWCARWHDIRSPVSDLDAFVADINRAIDDAGYEVLFASGDAEAIAISYARTSIRAIVPYAPHQALQRAIDKLEMTKVAEASGVPVPLTHEANDDALAGFTNGVVIKCRLHWEPGRNRNADRVQARIANDRDDARRHAAAFREADAAAIYQEFKPGHLMGFTVLTDQNADVVAQLQQMVPFTWDPGVPARAYTIAVDAHLSQCIARMLKDLEWYGLVQLQFIFADDGRPYLIDFNGRAYMSEALALTSGLNFHDLWARIATGREWKHPDRARIGARYQWLAGDLRRSRPNRDTRLSLSMLDCICHGVGTTHPIWQGNDPRPIGVYFQQAYLQKYMSRVGIRLGQAKADLMRRLKI
jgi:predicted ATP-grasp superfamily ATP-dependent carboligase